MGICILGAIAAKNRCCREVIAFPKVQNASELMTNCPDTVDDKNLKELHVKVDAE